MPFTSISGTVSMFISNQFNQLVNQNLKIMTFEEDFANNFTNITMMYCHLPVYISDLSITLFQGGSAILLCIHKN